MILEIAKFNLILKSHFYEIVKYTLLSKLKVNYAISSISNSLISAVIKNKHKGNINDKRF